MKLFRWHWIALVAVLIGVAVPLQVHRKATARAESTARKKARPTPPLQRPATSVVARSGLPNFSRKLHARAPLTIAFLGGSITQNAAAGGFVEEVPAWLKAHAEGVSVETVNAGVAGTGSDFGAQRIDRDVLVHRPDLVFVEFAVNDADRDCAADMERLVRKVRLANPETDIAFLYAVMDWSLPLLERGKFPPSVLRHEKVAAHYGIPTVALGYEAARKIRAGEWTWSDFSSDSCHPTAAGYASYNRDIDDALTALVGFVGSAPSLPPSLTPGLVVHPPPARAEPMPAAQPHTFELPRFGVHWIGAPQFPKNGEAMWRLDYRRMEMPASVEAFVGLDRAAWQPQRWFDEARSFTGSASHPLAMDGDSFGSSPTEASILTWRASASGSWLFQVSATALDGPRAAPDATAGVNVVRFPAGSAHGESVALMRTSSAESGAFDLSQRVELAAGDEVAFVFVQSHFKFAHYRGFRVVFGL